ncbi:MAG: hypothetical protein ACP5G7_02400 [Anaerolineae bacterium]
MIYWLIGLGGFALGWTLSALLRAYILDPDTAGRVWRRLRRGNRPLWWYD